MMRSHSALFPAVLMLLTGAACASGGTGKQSTPAAAPAADSGPPKLRGKVVGPDRTGLHGVKVTTAPPTDAVLTYRGKYEIGRVLESDSAITPGKYEIRFTKLGWTPRTVVVDYPGGVFNVPVVELGKPGGPAPSELGLHDEEAAQTGGQGTVRQDE